MVGYGCEQNRGSPVYDGMGDDRDIGGGRSLDTPRRRFGTDRVGSGAVSSGVRGAKVARWREGGLCVATIFCG